jgi:hypothetical protein
VICTGDDNNIAQNDSSHILGNHPLLSSVNPLLTPPDELSLPEFPFTEAPEEHVPSATFHKSSISFTSNIADLFSVRMPEHTFFAYSKPKDAILEGSTTNVEVGEFISSASM